MLAPLCDALLRACLIALRQSKRFTKALGLRVTAVYGGAGVADQIADLKRGAEIVVCTPGRMIDILTMQVTTLFRPRIDPSPAG